MEPARSGHSGWQAELGPDARFLRDLCEVRLAIEPIASGFAALRARRRKWRPSASASSAEERAGASRIPSEETAELDLRFHAAVVAACHNVLLRAIERRDPRGRSERRSLLHDPTARIHALGLGHTAAYEAIRGRDPLQSARRHPKKSSAWRCSRWSR